MTPGVPLTVRRARPSDAADLSALARRAKASWGYPARWLAAWEEALTLTPGYIRREVVLVAESGGAPVGVIALELRGDEAEVGHLWVDPGCQGRGVGRALFERGVREARAGGARTLRIESDPHARPFYERLGAVTVGEIPASVEGVERTLPVLHYALEGVSPDPDGTTGPDDETGAT